MTEHHGHVSIDGQSRSSLEKQKNIEHVEKAEATTLADEILQRYPLLVGKSEDGMANLNKKVLRKLDWKFLVKLWLFPKRQGHMLTTNLAMHHFHATHEVCLIPEPGDG